MRFAIGKIMILVAVIMITACGNLTEPSGFSFVTQNGVPTSTNIQSNVVTIKGNQFPSDITISDDSGGSNSQYSINGGAFTASNSTKALSPGNTLQLQQTSASTPNTTRVTTVTVGGFTTTFTTVTSTTGGGGSITDATGTVKISNLTATLSQGKTAVNVTVSATTNNTANNPRTVAFTLQAISSTGAVVAQYVVSSTSPAQIPAGSSSTVIFPASSAVTASLPSTTSTLPAGLPAAIDGNPPSTTAYWSKTISYWQIVPETLTFVQ